MPEDKIDNLISDYESAERRLLKILEDSGLEAHVQQADKELTSALTALLSAELTCIETRMARVDFLLGKLTSEDEPNSLNSRLREIILSDIAAISFGKREPAIQSFNGLNPQ